MTSAALRRLAREFRSIQSMEGVLVELEKDDLTKWNIHLRGFSPELDKQLERVNGGAVTLEATFPPEYPERPPFVRVVSPRFQFRTGHVTVGGSLCTELLTLSGSAHAWHAGVTMPGVVAHIRVLFVQGGARIQGAGAYSYAEAAEAHHRVTRQHGWQERSAWRLALPVLLICVCAVGIAALAYVFLV